MNDISVEVNSISGHIPACFGALTALTYVDFNTNRLSGPIPSNIGSLILLESLYLYGNRLTGPIPESLGDLQFLVFINAYRNKLSGPIPNSFGNATRLNQVYLHENELTGTIPSTLGQSGRLEELFLQDNQLRGSIPQSLGDVTQLVSLYLEHNQLTGGIPTSFCSAHFLGYLSIDYNMITGSIPGCIGSLNRLAFLSVQSNLLTGSLPASMGNITQLQYLLLDNNLLSGTIPSMFSSLSKLYSLELKGNRLSGSLTSIFSAAHTKLVTITLDDNQFTGKLPSTIFELPVLQSLSIVGACMHGTLPSNICNATYLEALILYGLTTGTSCRAQGVQSLSQSQRIFNGAFPSCLLSMPNIITLLLSSNGLTGSIPGNIVVGPKLLELDISHNDLTGSIPNSVQNHSWILLDLSHNKLSGVLQSELLKSKLTPAANLTWSETGQVVSLSSNRLSGHVPSSLMPLHNNLSVLAGNLFECRYDKSNLPQHDSDISNYQCASNSFDISVYVWLGLGVIIAMAGVVYIAATRCNVNAFAPSASLSLPDALSSRFAHLHCMLEQCQTIYKSGWYCAAFCVLVLLPYYAIVSHYEGTHTHQYAYVLSAIYVSGVAPFVVDVLLLAALLGTVCCVASRQVHVMTKKASSAVVPSTPWVRTCVRCVFAFANLAVVLGANVAFVYVVLYQSSQLQTIAQILLSLFKLGWSSWAAPYLIRQLDAYFSDTSDARPSEPYFTLQLLVALFNNIAIPCLVVAAIDPNCFSNVLLPPHSQSLSYLLPVCDLGSIGGTCVLNSYEVVSLTYTPPFTYSYQCSASFITSYAPTFIYMSMSTVFLSPLLQYVLVRLHQRLLAGSISHMVISWMLPRILTPPTASTVTVGHTSRTILGAGGTLVTLLTQLGILLTFGAIFPPVALAMAVSISAVVFMTRYKVQRYVHAVVEAQQLPVLDMINVECERVGTREQMRTAVVIIICYCCTFYAMFLFDTLGDAVGFDASVWVLFVVPLAPPGVLLNVDLHPWYLGKSTVAGSSVVVDSVSAEGTKQIEEGVVMSELGQSNVANVLHIANAEPY